MELAVLVPVEADEVVELLPDVEEMVVDVAVPAVVEPAVLVEDPVPVLPDDPVLIVEVLVKFDGNGQQGRQTHCSVGGETSANRT